MRTGRPVACNLINWDLVALGSKSDKDIAAKLHVSDPAVRIQRVKRSIPAFPKRQWDTSLLGKIPDPLIAKITGLHESTIGEARRSLGINRSDRIYLTTEGEPATFPEAIIDLYWHKHNIPHKFQARLGKYIPDWIINNTTVVEYAGWIAASPKFSTRYNLRLIEKELFYKTQGYSTLIIYPNDLSNYDTKQTPVIVDKILTRTRKCIQCGVNITRKFPSHFRNPIEKTVCIQCRGKFTTKNRVRDYSDISGEKNSQWKGGIMISYGYAYVKMPQHPRANKAGYVKRVNLIIENIIGRYIEKGEEVHFINENRSDERSENLQLMTKSQHMVLHTKLRKERGSYKGCHSHQSRINGKYTRR